MKKLTLIILAIVVCLLMCACGDKVDDVVSEVSTESLLVGKWELVSGNTENDEMTLYNDGTCMVDDEAGTWKVYGDELCILGGFSGQFWDHDNFSCEYRFENEMLVIDYRDGLVYQRVF